MKSASQGWFRPKAGLTIPSCSELEMGTATLSRRSQCAHSDLPRDLISTGKAARILGLSIQGVVNMMNRGELTGFTLSSGHRRISRRVVLEAAGFDGGEEFTEREKVIVYGRVSTHRQSSEKKTGSSDLTRQIQRLEKLAKERYPDRELVTIKDVGSGMNFDKPGLDRLISGMLSGEFRDAKLLVEHKDRLARWAVPIIEKIADHAGVEIEYVEQHELGDEEMLVADLLAITTIFSTKLYSRRSAERRRKQLSGEFIQRATELVNQGLPVQQVAKQMELEGFKDERGGVVGHGVIYGQIVKPLDKLRKIIPNSETPVQRYIRENVDCEMPLNYRVRISDLHAHYVEWCQKEGVTPVTSFRLTSNLPRKIRRCGFLKGVVVKTKKLHTVVKVIKENAKTTRMNEKLAEFCKANGLSYSSAQQRMQTV